MPFPPRKHGRKDGNVKAAQMTVFYKSNGHIENVVYINTDGTLLFGIVLSTTLTCNSET